MAWVMVDDLTDERITEATGGGDVVIGFAGDDYELHLTTASQAKVHRELAVVLSRGRPLNGAPVITAPDATDEDDWVTRAAGPPEIDLDYQDDTGGTCPVGPDMDTVGPEVEPDARTRAEELLEQNWTPARVAGTTGLDLNEVREMARALKKSTNKKAGT